MNSKIVEQLRKEYPVGAKVELLRMDDFQAPPIGTTGIVQFVDDMGTIHVNWSTGSSLGVAYGEDKCRVID
jgi:hypothetical protein